MHEAIILTNEKDSATGGLHYTVRMT